MGGVVIGEDEQNVGTLLLGQTGRGQSQESHEQRQDSYFHKWIDW